MRAAILVLLSCVALAGCGGVEATATPDSKTPAGYRQLTLSRAQRVTETVDAVNGTCSKETVQKCGEVIGQQRPVFDRESEQFRTTTPPQICGPFFGGYLGLMDNATEFFDKTQGAVASNNQTTVVATVAEVYAGYKRGKTTLDGYLREDKCR